MRKIGRTGFEPVRRRFPAGGRVRVAEVETDPEPRIVHLPDNVQKHRSVGLHDVLEAHRKMFRYVRNQSLPDKHGPRDEPLRVIHQRHKARVQNELRDAQLRGLFNRLPIALFRNFQYKRVNRSGGQLVKRAVHDKAVR